MTTVAVRELARDDVHEARRRYAALYAKALPHAGGLEPERIEVATFNCSSTLAEFDAVGLGLETVVIFRDEGGDGHTGKVLMNLPWQLLPEHSHVDTVVLRRGARVSPGFRELKTLVNGFTGIRACAGDGSPLLKDGRPVYLYPDGDFVIVQAEDSSRPREYPAAADVERVFPGKSETFKAICGDAVLFTDSARVIHAPRGADPARVPPEFAEGVARIRREQTITTERLLYLAPGTEVLLPKCTRHALLAGREGCVYLEFSTPSMDEADRFSDPRIIR